MPLTAILLIRAVRAVVARVASSARVQAGAIFAAELVLGTACQLRTNFRFSFKK